MPKRTNEFQRLVTLLNATLAGHANVTESAMVRDKVTKEEREVDILLTTRAANYNVIIGIEVVAWKRRADTPWIEKMRAKHENLETNKLILVSESGFTQPAIEKARFYNIETLTLEAAHETDWPFVAKLGLQELFKETNLKYNCSILCEFGDGTRELIEAPLEASFSIGEYSITINEFVLDILNKQDFRDAIYSHIEGSGEHDFWFSFTSPGLSLVHIENKGRLGYIQEIRVDLKILTNETIIRHKTGKFQEMPFFAGVSSSDEDHPLQFVVLRTPKGAIRGYIVDKDGTRTLTVFDAP